MAPHSMEGCGHAIPEVTRLHTLTHAVQGAFRAKAVHVHHCQQTAFAHLLDTENIRHDT